MADLKETIRGLNEIAKYFHHLQEIGFFGDQPVFREREEYCKDAISLLKKQVAKDVKTIKGTYGQEFYFCPECDKQFYGEIGRPSYCCRCGQEVKWNKMTCDEARDFIAKSSGTEQNPDKDLPDAAKPDASNECIPDDEWIQRIYPTSIDILGESWQLVFVDPKQKGSGFDDHRSASGYCSPHNRKIVLREVKSCNFPDDFTLLDKMHAINKTLRHEIIHAYLYESGLDGNAFCTTKAWPKNEEMIDWFAIQGPKIVSTWNKVDCTY